MARRDFELGVDAEEIVVTLPPLRITPSPITVHNSPQLLARNFGP